MQTSDETDDDGQMPRSAAKEKLFKGRHFDHEIVVLCVRWYLIFKLSFRDLVAMMGERSIHLAHTTILRWVQHYTPEFEKRWNRYARAVGSWRMDETYVKERAEWVYLYRGVDMAGKSVRDTARVGAGFSIHTATQAMASVSRDTASRSRRLFIYLSRFRAVG